MAGPTTLSGILMGNAPSASLPFDCKWEPAPVIVAAAFDVMGVDVRSFREPLTRSIKQVMIPSIGKNFDSGGRPSAWAALALDTETFRAKDGYNPTGPILVRSGMLKRTATQLNIWQIDTQKATVTNLDVAQSGKAWYGVAQQSGFTGGFGAVTPSRPFMMIQDQDMADIEEVFLVWLDERMLAAGFHPGSIV